MAQYSSSGARFNQNSTGATGGQFDDEDEEDSFSQQNYLPHYHRKQVNYGQADSGLSNGPQAGEFEYQRPETIQVKLSEGYFANERKALVNMVANCRQKFNSMQMFNPAKNQSTKERQENWNENVSFPSFVCEIDDISFSL